MERDKLNSLLIASDLHYSNDAANELPHEIDASFGYVEAREIYDIYKKRLGHLSTKESEHATQLAKATDAFLRNLSHHINGKLSYVSTSTNNEHHYLIFITKTENIVGVLKVISQLDVSSKRWSEIWQKS